MNVREDLSESFVDGRLEQASWGEGKASQPSRGREPQALTSFSSSPLRHKAVRISRCPSPAPGSVEDVQSHPLEAARGRRTV